MILRGGQKLTVVDNQKNTAGLTSLILNEVIRDLLIMRQALVTVPICACQGMTSASLGKQVLIPSSTRLLAAYELGL